MSIATELQSLNDNILDAYTAIQGKGGTVPAQKNTANLDTAIASIPAGPDVYIPLEVTEQGLLRKPSTSFAWSTPASVTSIAVSTLWYAFYNCTNLTSVDLNNVAIINDNGLYYAFYGCTHLTSADLSSVTYVYYGGLRYAFEGCSSLTSVDLSSLVTVGREGLSTAFELCTSLTSVNFASVANINKAGFRFAFQSCTGLTTLRFPALTASSFGSSTNQFYGMLNGCSNVTVHFPAAIQSTIGSWSDVTNGFGGTNTTVLFDL